MSSLPEDSFPRFADSVSSTGAAWLLSLPWSDSDCIIKCKSLNIFKNLKTSSSSQYTISGLRLNSSHISAISLQASVIL